jgi:protoporphyrin/coproporphyrin ferrochelatase
MKYIGQTNFSHNYPPYIEALSKSIEGHREKHGRADKLLMSYHGISFRYLKNDDPYHCECHKTSRL